jgi:hypothetical protein
VGGGLRIFFNRWLAMVLEVSDYIYSEQLENTSIATGTTTINGTVVPKSQDASTWLGSNSLTNNVQAQLGLSFFLPFTWEYRLPK